MKVLTKYILKLSIGPFLMGLFGFVVFASVELLYQLSDIIVRHRVGILKLFELIYYNLPYFISMGIPVGVLFSIFWVLSQLYNSKEITALLVHGIPSKKLVFPFFLLAIVFGLFAFYLNDQIVPKFNQKAVETISKYVYKKPELNIRENILTKIDDEQYFFVKKYDQENGVLYDVVLFQNFDYEERIITADRVIKEENAWYLLNGKMYVTDESGFLKLDMNFSRIKLDLKEDLENLMRFGKSPRDMTGKELKNKITTFSKLGIDPSPWIVELHSRYANSVGPFIIALLGVPLSLLFGLKSKSWSVILTFGIVVLYQGSGAWLAAMGKENLINPYFSAWIPNIIFGFLGIFLFLVLDTPFAYKIREFMSKLFILAVFVIIFFNTQAFSSVITLDASNIFFFEDTVLASGNVQILWNENNIISDFATITIEDKNAKYLEAEGNVEYRYKERVYYAKYLKYTFDKDKSYSLRVRGNFDYKSSGKKVNLYFGAESVITYPSSSLLSEAYITTCELEHPHYKIESLNVFVYEGKYIVAENSLLFILDIPFLPYPVYFASISEREKPPFSFSFSWSPYDGFSTNQGYVSHINDLVLETSINTSKDDTNFKLLINNSKTNEKFSLDFGKNILNLQTKNFEYKINWKILNTSAKLIFGDFYFEQNYVSETSWNKRVGFTHTFSTKPTKSIFNFYLDYNGQRSLIYNSFLLNNLSFSLNDFLKFKVNNLTSNVSVYKEGFFLDDSTWITNENIRYKFSLFDGKYFNTIFDVFYGNNQYTSKIDHKFVLPYSFTYKNFQLNAQYEFDMDVYNAFTNEYYFQIGMFDDYKISIKYNLKPLTFETKYRYRINFGDESTSNNISNFNFILSLKDDFSGISVSKGWDFLNNKQLNDLIDYNLHFSINDYNFSFKASSEYDNEDKILLPSNVNLNIVNSKVRLNYKSNFKFYHAEDVPIKDITHTLVYQNLKGSVTQSIEEDYIKNAYFKGTFVLEDFKNSLSFSFYKSSKIDDARFNLNYNLEVNKNKFSISYGSVGKNLKFGLSINSIDPSFVLGGTYDFKKEKFTVLQFSFSKKLHHWVFNFNSEFSFNDDGKFDFNDVQKLSILFYVIEFSEKFFGWDLKNNEPSIGLF
ncbi:MAG: LptF/LptG family permease [Thermosipho sp. (in: Bacteria)]|nr:LptF/LptG family permease [Thermosipho sp. (in: thermotogales)]